MLEVNGKGKLEYSLAGFALSGGSNFLYGSTIGWDGVVNREYIYINKEALTSCINDIRNNYSYITIKLDHLKVEPDENVVKILKRVCEENQLPIWPAGKREERIQAYILQYMKEQQIDEEQLKDENFLKQLLRGIKEENGYFYEMEVKDIPHFNR